MTGERSPLCMRCAPSHGIYPHNYHESNEHDEWLAAMKGKYGKAQTEEKD